MPSPTAFRNITSHIDRRPRVSYRLPDGTVGEIILDHGAVIKPAITFASDGRIRMAYLVDPSLAGTVAQ